MEIRQRAVENMERKINKKFWKNKRVFVTGHTGFKGSWLTLWLKLLGAEVTGYSLSPSSIPSMFDAANVQGGITSVTGDIRDYVSLEKAMTEAKPEIVFHLAAQPLVRQSYKNPRETYETNVMGTVNLLESVRKTKGIKSVVIVTTDKCYENNEWVYPYRENDRLGGHDPYSNSKACAELVTDAYRRSFLAEAGVPVASARAGNVIGGGDWSEDRLVPDIMRFVFEGKTLVIRNPKSLRPWQHVLDPLFGYLLLAQTLVTEGPQFAQSWNFAPSEKAKTVEELLSMLENALSEKIDWKKDTKVHPHEANYLQLDATKARELLGWDSKVPLADAVVLSGAWYKTYYEGKSARDITLEQITKYMEGVVR